MYGYGSATLSQLRIGFEYDFPVQLLPHYHDAPSVLFCTTETVVKNHIQIQFLNGFNKHFSIVTWSQLVFSGCTEWRPNKLLGVSGEKLHNQPINSFNE